MRILGKTLVSISLCLLPLSGCALTEGAIAVNAEVSNAVRDQQGEVEKALRWAFEPYYENLREARPSVLEKAVQIEKRARAISAWRSMKIEEVRREMINDKVAYSEGSKRCEELKVENPTPSELENLIKQTALPSADLINLMDAVNIRYTMAKEELDAELNKVINQLRQNTENIVTTNDKITQALEQQKNSRLEAIKLAQTILSITSTVLPGGDKLAKIVEQFTKNEP